MLRQIIKYMGWILFQVQLLMFVFSSGKDCASLLFLITFDPLMSLTTWTYVAIISSMIYSTSWYLRIRPPLRNTQKIISNVAGDGLEVVLWSILVYTVVPTGWNSLAALCVLVSSIVFCPMPTLRQRYWCIFHNTYCCGVETRMLKPGQTIFDKLSNTTDSKSISTTKEKCEIVTCKNIEDVTCSVLEALQELERANFTSGVHFCPPNFVNHGFFTEEMAKEYKKWSGKDGQLREYSGKIWEELIYHALMENLPHLVGPTPIACMWVFNGLTFSLKNKLLSTLSIIPTEDIEIDFLVAGITKNGKIFVIPIEVKHVSAKNVSDQRRKANAQCKKISNFFGDSLQPLLGQTDWIFKPAIFLCWNRCDNKNTGAVTEYKCFNIDFEKYEDHFVFGQNRNINVNFLSWIANEFDESEVAENVGNVVDGTVASGDKNMDYQIIVCLLVSVLCCKINKNMTKHNEKFCYKHFYLSPENLDGCVEKTVNVFKICMEGIALCPKYINEHVRTNVNSLNYLKTFKNAGDGFKCHPVSELRADVRLFAKIYFTHVTNEQKIILESDDDHVVILGEYGTGKTLMLLIKCMALLHHLKKNSAQLQRTIVFASTRKNLDLFVIPEFKKHFCQNVLNKFLSFRTVEALTDKLENLNGPFDHFLFMDERGEVIHNKDNFNYKGRNTTEILNTTIIPWCWSVIARSAESSAIVGKNDKVLFDLTWQLRNVHSVSYFSKLINSPQSDVDMFNYPIYGSRSRVVITSVENSKQAVSKELQYWQELIKDGKVLVYNCNDSEELIYDITRLTTEKHYKYKIQIQTNVSRNEFDNIQLLSGLEFDAVILVGMPLRDRMTKVISRAKHGISWVVLDTPMIENFPFCECGSQLPDQMLKRFETLFRKLSRWGRYSVRGMDAVHRHIDSVYLEEDDCCECFVEGSVSISNNQLQNLPIRTEILLAKTPFRPQLCTKILIAQIDGNLIVVFTWEPSPTTIYRITVDYNDKVQIHECDGNHRPFWTGITDAFMQKIIQRNDDDFETCWIKLLISQIPTHVSHHRYQNDPVEIDIRVESRSKQNGFLEKFRSISSTKIMETAVRFPENFKVRCSETILSLGSNSTDNSYCVYNAIHSFWDNLGSTLISPEEFCAMSIFCDCETLYLQVHYTLMEQNNVAASTLSATSTVDIKSFVESNPHRVIVRCFYRVNSAKTFLWESVKEMNLFYDETSTEIMFLQSRTKLFNDLSMDARNVLGADVCEGKSVVDLANMLKLEIQISIEAS